MVFKWKDLAILSLIGLMMFPIQIFAQTKHTSKKSQKYFNQALESYKQSELESSEEYLLSAIRFDTLNVKAYLLLYDVSKELLKTEQQMWALQHVLNLDSINHPTVYKLLADLYFQEGKYQKALNLWLKYDEIGHDLDSTLIDENLEKCKHAIQLINHPSSAVIHHLGPAINSEENEYWPLIATDDSTIYFTRLITQRQKFAFERIYFSQLTDSAWTTAHQLNIGSDEMVNEGTMSMTADANLIFFTSCGQRDGMGSCDIYYLQKSDGRWNRPRNAGSIINTVYWEAQPAVSALGDKLYFSSNRPGGFGDKDIWVSEISKSESGDLKFEVPTNLGNRVNSRKNDFSPFIHADDQTLYFASDGRSGLGKSDLFITQLKDSLWTTAQNLGVPVNSNMDDDGLVVSPTAHLAILSSNRSGSVNHSKDLYVLQLPDIFRPNKVGYLKGLVFDALTRKQLDASIRLVDLSEGKVEQITSTINNGFITTLKADRTYAFHISKPGYLFYSKHFNLTDPQQFSSASVLNIYLQPIQLDATVILNNIFFDFNSYELTNKSIPELDELILFLKINPGIDVEISGHTDNVGSASYNLQLSENRAKEIAKYLSQSIASARMVVRGYGDQKPIDNNNTEEGRSRNRRSELRIIGN